MYPGEDGQIRSKEEEAKTIKIDCGEIGTMDFSSPVLDEMRGRCGQAKMKNDLIAAAEKLVTETFMQPGE